jgi:hypothetical protein
VTIDGGLRKLFQEHLKTPHWQAIETGGTGRGIPDLNGCLAGAEFWIELKCTHGWVVSTVQSEQVGWVERRERAGGRVFAAVRQMGRDRDVLWLLRPGALRALKDKTRLDELPGALLVGRWEGGPAHWDWNEVGRSLVHLATPLNPPGIASH